MVTLLYRCSQSGIFCLMIGIVLGVTLASTVSLFCWSLSPTNETKMIPKEMSSLTVLLNNSGSNLGQLTKLGGGGGRGCVCGLKSSSELESKHSGAMDWLDVTLPSPHIGHPVLRKSMQHQAEQTMDRAKRMKEELVVAVIIDGTQLEWAKSAYETWGHDTTHLVFYVKSSSNINIQEAWDLGLHVVKLQTSTSVHIYPTLLQHLGEHYMKLHQWFVVVTEDTYVRMDQLEAVLGRLGQDDPLILGLPPHCQLRKRGSGGSMVMNQALLALLTQQLHLCLNESMEVADSLGSMEACVGKNLNIHCSISSLMQKYFVEMQADQMSISSRMLQSQNKLFFFLLTYSHLRQTKDMYVLHHHYKMTQLIAAKEKTKHLQQEVKEVCKSLGPSFSSTKDCSSSNLSSQVDQPPYQSSSKCPSIGVISSVPEPYHPKSIYDNLSWDFFNSKTIYHEQSIQPNYNLGQKKDVEKELQQALTQAVQMTTKRLGQHVKFKKQMNGWVRHDPFVGNEYIIDTLFTNGKKVISKRAHLVRPLARNYISLKDDFVDSITVNIVIPISGVIQRFTKFMSMYEDLVFIPMKNVNLVLSVYGQEDVIEVNNILAEYRVKYEHAHVMVVEGKGEFSRSKALHLGLSQLLPNDLVFICDVDMVISTSFLDRCRSNTVQSSRVYFPEVFKQYNMDYVYWDSKKPSHQHSIISRATGYWAYFGFGLVCIYKSDYDSVGGMETKITGWGGEDVLFFLKILKKTLQVMRAPDVGLSHYWHPKYCAKTLSTTQYRSCLSSMSENLADKSELARFVLGQLSPMKTITDGGRASRR